MWREGLGAYKIITHKQTTLTYYKHPATQEYASAPEILHDVLDQVRTEMLKRNYHPKPLPEKVSFNGELKPWQTLEEQINHIKTKKCKCTI